MVSTEERAKAANEVLIKHFDNLLLQKLECEEKLEYYNKKLEEIKSKLSVWED